MDASIVIPVYGREELTDQVLRDLGKAAEDVILVDNLGTYIPKVAVRELLAPGTNLGWAGGCNRGVEAARKYAPEYYCILNNDVRLSPQFITGLIAGARAVGAAVIGPQYDHNWHHQRGQYLGHASNYIPHPRERLVPFVDGTCLMLSAACLDQIGVLLDAVHWPVYGWGCDKDLCLRVRDSGGKVFVTERSYLNHLGRETVQHIDTFSEAPAELENDRGMRIKHGGEWQDRLFRGFDHLSRFGDTQLRLET